MYKKLLFALIISLLGGCISLGGDQKNANAIYVLADASALPLNAQPALTHTLLIEATRGNEFDNHEALVFSRAPHTRGRYKFAHWSELPSTRFSELLFNRLSTANVYTTVANASSDVIPDRRLVTELLAFYHDASTNPGHVHMVVRAELYDSQHHRLIARRVFEQNTPLASYDAEGAAAAFNLATQHILTDISAWLQASDI